MSVPNGPNGPNGPNMRLVPLEASDCPVLIVLAHGSDSALERTPDMLPPARALEAIKARQELVHAVVTEDTTSAAAHTVLAKAGALANMWTILRLGHSVDREAAAAYDTVTEARRSRLFDALVFIHVSWSDSESSGQQDLPPTQLRHVGDAVRGVFPRLSQQVGLPGSEPVADWLKYSFAGYGRAHAVFGGEGPAHLRIEVSAPLLVNVGGLQSAMESTIRIRVRASGLRRRLLDPAARVHAAVASYGGSGPTIVRPDEFCWRYAGQGFPVGEVISELQERLGPLFECSLDAVDPDAR